MTANGGPKPICCVLHRVELQPGPAELTKSQSGLFPTLFTLSTHSCAGTPDVSVLSSKLLDQVAEPLEFLPQLHDCRLALLAPCFHAVGGAAPVPLLGQVGIVPPWKAVIHSPDCPPQADADDS